MWSFIAVVLMVGAGFVALERRSRGKALRRHPARRPRRPAEPADHGFFARLPLDESLRGGPGSP